jgi:hypothetical protein
MQRVKSGNGFDGWLLFISMAKICQDGISRDLGNEKGLICLELSNNTTGKVISAYVTRKSLTPVEDGN